MNEARLSPAAIRVFHAIQDAMARHAPMTIRFRYASADGTISERHAEPYEIKELDGGRAVLFAHCLDRDAIRQFSLENISDISMGPTFKARHAVRVPC